MNKVAFSDAPTKISCPVEIILLPGIFNRASKFYSLLILYLSARGYQCTPIDLPFRKSTFQEIHPPTLGGITIADDAKYVGTEMCRIINRACREGKKVVVVGHSRGALLAQMVAEKFGNQIDALVLLNPAPPAGISCLSWDGIKTFLCLLKHGAFWRKPVKRSFESFRKGVLDPNMSVEEAEMLYNNLVWESGKVIWQIAFQPPQIDEEKINCPVAVVCGTKDKLIKLKVAELIAEKYNASLLKFEVPHYPFHGQQGEQVMAYVDRWLRLKLGLKLN